MRYTLHNGRLYDASTLAPVDGRGGAAPRFLWTDLQTRVPAPSCAVGCATCRKAALRTLRPGGSIRSGRPGGMMET